MTQHPTPGYLPQGHENIKGPHKDMYPTVHKLFIHNKQKLEATKMPIYVHTMECYSAIKMKDLLILAAT